MEELVENKTGFTISEVRRNGDGAVQSLRARCNACGLDQRPLKGNGTAVPGQFSGLIGGGIELACGNRDCDNNESYSTEEL